MKKIISIFMIGSFFFFTIGCCGLLSTAHAQTPSSCCHSEKSTKADGVSHNTPNPAPSHHSCNCVKIFDVVKKQTSLEEKYFQKKHHRNFSTAVHATIKNSSFVVALSTPVDSASITPNDSVPIYLKNSVLRL